MNNQDAFSFSAVDHFEHYGIGLYDKVKGEMNDGSEIIGKSLGYCSDHFLIHVSKGKYRGQVIEIYKTKAEKIG